jgi:undecaprenyl-diphosphatase
MIGIAAIAAMLFAFAKIGEEMVEGDTRAFDVQVLLSLRTPGNSADPIGPVWFEEMMRDFSALGSTGVLITVTLAVTGFLVISGRRRMALVMAASITSGMLISQTLKWGFARSRPDLVPALTRVYTHSFPSGHAMMSAVVYLTIGVLFARTTIRTALKAYLLSIATLLTLIVGVSRVYLGVHWPTDVLAGWAGGAAWALLCWLAMLWLQSRGKIETDLPILSRNIRSGIDS